MKCGHERCSCEVAEGDHYCSDFCREPTDTEVPTGNDCGCGHDACRLMTME